MHVTSKWMKLRTQYVAQSFGVLLAKVEQVRIVRAHNSAWAAPPDWDKQTNFSNPMNLSKRNFQNYGPGWMSKPELIEERSESELLSTS